MERNKEARTPEKLKGKVRTRKATEQRETREEVK